MDTGFAYPGTAGQVDTGTYGWVNPDYIKSDDGNYAVCQIPAYYSPTYYNDTLFGRNFGFSIGGTSPITGIEVVIQHAEQGAIDTYDYVVQLSKNGGSSGVGDNKANTSTLWATYPTEEAWTYGGAGDLWGTTWSAAEINSSNFAVIFRHSGKTYNTWGQSKIDYMKVKVYYAPPPSGFITLAPNH